MSQNSRFFSGYSLVLWLTATRSALSRNAPRRDAQKKKKKVDWNFASADIIAWDFANQGWECPLNIDELTSLLCKGSNDETDAVV